jgi:hypothetical protein
MSLLFSSPPQVEQNGVSRSSGHFLSSAHSQSFRSPSVHFPVELIPNQSHWKEIIPLSSLHSFASQEGLVFGHSFFFSSQAQPAFGATQNPSLAPQSSHFGLSPLQASSFLWAGPPSLGAVNAAASPPTSPLRYQATPPANTTAATVAAGSPDFVADTVRVAVMLS